MKDIIFHILFILVFNALFFIILFPTMHNIVIGLITLYVFDVVAMAGLDDSVVSFLEEKDGQSENSKKD